MDWLLSFIQGSVSFLVPFIILLGILVFVHEMGHFLVAKFYKVKVEVFSLGFGPKIFQFQRGDTNYCVSLIPLGGYVKMFGDDPSTSDKVPEEERHGSFLHKPVGQRMAIVLAGPLVNLFFAALVFFVVAIVGEEMISPIVGDVEEDSAAWTYGFRAGDTIQAINGEPIKTWDDVKAKVEGLKNEELSFDIVRMEEAVFLQATTSVIPNPNILSTEEEVGDIKGLTFVARETQIGIISPGSILAQSGMQSFDRIQSINGTVMKKWYEIVSFLENYNQSEPLEIKYLRPPKEEDISQADQEVQTAHIEFPLNMVGQLSPEMLGFERPDLYVYKFTEDSPAQESGMLHGDRIRSIDGEMVNNWAGLVEKVQSYNPDRGDGFDVEVMREGEIENISVTPKLVEQPDNRGGRQPKYALGIFTNIFSGPTDRVLIRTFNPLLALKKGVLDTWYWTKITCLSLLRLMQARVSPRAIGGPIMIGQVASQTFQMGLSYFLKIMAIISINLFILNMLPIPVLDGGHLLFFTIEALRGAPLSMKKMEIAQMVGLIFILCLMALAIFNDISRIFEG